VVKIDSSGFLKLQGNPCSNDNDTRSLPWSISVGYAACRAARCVYKLYDCVVVSGMDGNLGICDFPSFFFIENEETATEFENISAVVSVLFDDDTMYGDREAIALNCSKYLRHKWHKRSTQNP